MQQQNVGQWCFQFWVLPTMVPCCCGFGLPHQETFGAAPQEEPQWLVAQSVQNAHWADSWNCIMDFLFSFAVCAHCGLGFACAPCCDVTEDQCHPWLRGFPVFRPKWPGKLKCFGLKHFNRRESYWIIPNESLSIFLIWGRGWCWHGLGHGDGALVWMAGGCGDRRAQGAVRREFSRAAQVHGPAVGAPWPGNVAPG